MSKIEVDEIVNQTGDNDSGLDLSTNDQIKIKIAGTDVGKITGTNDELRIAGTVADKDLTFQINDGGSEITAGIFNADIAGAFQVRDGSATNPSLGFQNNTGMGMFRQAADNLGIACQGSERVRFTNSYNETQFNPGVGSNGGTVTINSSTSGRAVINTTHTLTGQDSSGYPYGILMYMPNIAGDQVNNRHTFKGGGSATTFTVAASGNVKNSNNSYGAISDERIKENIEDASTQWDDIKALRVRKFSFKADKLDKPNMLGVIAQEVEQAGMNGLVMENDEEEIDKEGNWKKTGTQKEVKYSILYMKAVKALQEAMARIETLETKVTALESK
tara:strand:+ start:100 stop:1095 length:996 start_codon:yes stop_codon:yes gene_type:complete